MHARSKIVLTLLGVGMAMLLTGCETMAISETERTICRELRRDLPTYSTQDTAATLESGADFLDVFEAVCGDGK